MDLMLLFVRQRYFYWTTAGCLT